MGVPSKRFRKSSPLTLVQWVMVCLARALLRRCPVLALDEATAHVDAATELIFKAALQGNMLRQTRPTVLYVAHRPESLAVVDRILVVNGATVHAQNSNACMRLSSISL